MIDTDKLPDGEYVLSICTLPDSRQVRLLHARLVEVDLKGDTYRTVVGSDSARQGPAPYRKPCVEGGAGTGILSER